MTNKLTDSEVKELKSLLTDRTKVAMVVAIMGAAATIISAIGTAVASVVVALNSKGN